jgi:putative ATP-dependent endonuclease of OLD family
LNHFHIPYLVLHDEDQGNPFENGRNETIAGLCQAAEGASQIHMISPNNIEALLGYAATGKDKQYQALQRVEALHQAGGLPPAFQLAVRWAYFGQADEPLPQ